MSRFLLASFFVVMSLPLHTQNRDPQTREFTGTTADKSRLTRATDKFVLGWNWGRLPPRKSLSDSLHVNTIHFAIPLEPHAHQPLRQELYRIPDRIDLIAASAEVSQSDKMPYAWSTAMQWDPTLGNTAAVAHDFTPREGDTTGAVWGFAEAILGRVPSKDVLDLPFDPDHFDFDRAIYEHDELSAYNLFNNMAAETPQRVLASAQPDNELFLGAPFARQDNFDAWGLSHVSIRDPRIVTMDIDIQDPGGNTVRLPAWADTTLRGGDSTLYYAHVDSSEWYLTINTRRRDELDHTPALPNEAVLSLRVRCIHAQEWQTSFADGSPAVRYNNYDTVYVEFDSVSAAASLQTDDHYGIMDRQLAAHAGGTERTWFCLTKDMFPSTTAPPSRDVTRSAWFRLPKFFRSSRYESAPNAALDGRLPAGHESFAVSTDGGVSQEWLYAWPELSQDPPIITADSTRTPLRHGIIRVQPEVWYYGGYDVAIDWVRIESRMARMILRGHRDDMIETIQQDDYDALDAVNQAEGSDMRILRHYLADETPAMYWRTARHIHLLLEQAGSVELDMHNALHSRYQSAQQQYWHTFAHTGTFVAAPFLPFGDSGQFANDQDDYFNTRTHRCMGLKIGYRWGDIPSPPQTPNLTRDYETFIHKAGAVEGTAPPSMWTADEQSYRDWVEYSAGLATFQPHYEIHTARELDDYAELFYDPNARVWMNPWVHFEMIPRYPQYEPAAQANFRDKVMEYIHHRPKTGEEFDLYMWTALLMGSKGLLYYKGGASLDLADFDGIRRIGISRADIRPDASDGGDFMDSSDPFFDLMDVDSLARCMGLDPVNPRFYIGSATLRSKMLRLHDWIADNEAELLRLQLLGYWNKGYKAYSGVADDDLPLSNFLDLDLDAELPRLQTARLHDDTGNAWSGDAENVQDESFVAFTILKDKNLEIDSVFYVGVLNRRSNPAVYDPNGIGTDLRGGMQFYSSNEFQEHLTGGRFNNFAQPAYAQRGARRITVPFDVHIDDLFVNLHVQEVGGSLDTMIRADQSIALDFTPGEGKLLRVTVLKPDLTAQGGLEYSNQRKLIAWPVANEMMIYHMVYHRPMPTDPTRFEVFYRRSAPIAPVHSDRPLSWESTEVRLGEFVFRDGSGTGTMHSCAYPSLVVREDDNNNAWVYVVYACTEDPAAAILSNPTSQLTIAEHMFPIDANLTSISSTGRFVALAEGNDLAEWGTPVIGAAHGGNFIAWADELLGIGITHRSPLQGSAYAPTTYLHRDPGSGPYNASHPALTSYARLDLDEADAGLAWQENGQIYYTRVELTSGLVTNFIQKYYTHTAMQRVLQDRQMLHLSVDCRENRRPAIYRHIDEGNSIENLNANHTKVIIDMDEVAWEARAPASNVDSTSQPGPWRVHHLSILNVDGVDNGTRYRFRGMTNTPGRIRSLGSDDADIIEPNLAQGDYVANHIDIAGFRWHYNDARDAVLLNLSRGNGQLWHFPLAIGTWKRLWDHGLQLTDYGNRHLLRGSGHNPQLAAMPLINANLNIKRGRRVFSGDDGNIRPSGQYFQKSGADAVVMTFHGFADFTLVGCPTFGGVAGLTVAESRVSFENPIRLREIQVGSPPQTVLDLQRYPDTIRTDSFSITAAADVALDFLGAGLGLMRLDLVRNSDGQRTNLALPVSSDEAVARTSYQLINGGGEMFHLEFYPVSTQSEYTTEVVLGETPLIDGGMARSSQTYPELNARQQFVNLAEGAASGSSTDAIGLATWPQPSAAIVNIGAWLNYSRLHDADPSANSTIRLRLVDMTGRVCHSWNLTSGSSLRADLSDLPKGIYTLHATAQAGRDLLTAGKTLMLK